MLLQLWGVFGLRFASLAIKSMGNLLPGHWDHLETTGELEALCETILWKYN